jgi:hypothetical protein
MMAEGHRRRRREASLTGPSTVAESQKARSTAAKQSTQLLSRKRARCTIAAVFPVTMKLL